LSPSLQNQLQGTKGIRTPRSSADMERAVGGAVDCKPGNAKVASAAHGPLEPNARGAVESASEGQQPSVPMQTACSPPYGALPLDPRT